MLPIHINRNERCPLYEQIATQICNMINSNTLQTGAKLPSMRDLARQLGVNRNTVALAYTNLETNGLVQSGVGRGTFVRGITGGISSTADKGAGELDWEGLLAQRSTEITHGVLERISMGDGRSRIDLTGPVADSGLFPAEEFREVMSEVVREMGPQVLDYGSREGYPPLRRWLADRLTTQGVPVDESEVFIISGAQQGLDLIGKLLLDEGDGVVIESPTYTNAIGAFRLFGARLLPVPLDDTGIRPGPLEDTLQRERVKLIYCMPTFQNPTGISMDRPRREKVLELSRQYGVAILEDHFDTDLRYWGRERRALRGLDGGENVLFLGTFSKILFPGLRLGWIVAPPDLHDPILRLRRCTDLTAGLLAQAAIHRFCEHGLLDRHLEKVRRVNRGRLQALLDAMETHFPDEVVWTRPDGGMTLWVTLPREIDSVNVLIEARRIGVDFTPGPLFHVDGGSANAFRLSFSLENEQRITEGVRIIGDILKGKMSGSKPADSSVVLL